MEKDPKSIKNNSESNEASLEKRSKFKNTAKAVGLAAIILATSTFGVGCGEKATLASEQPTITEQEPGQTTETSETESMPDDEFYNLEKIYPNGVDIPEGWKTPDPETNFYIEPTNIVEGNCFNQLTPEQQSEIKKIEAMSLQEFDALPQQEQLKYAYWLIENYKPIHDMYISINGEKNHFTPKPETAQDIVDNIDYVQSMFGMFSTVEYNKKADTKEFTYDMKNAEKLVAAIYYNDGQSFDRVRSSLSVVGINSIIPSKIMIRAYSIESDDRILINLDMKTFNDVVEGEYGVSIMDFKDIEGNDRKATLIDYGICKSDGVQGVAIQELSNPRVDVNTPIINY